MSDKGDNDSDGNNEVNDGDQSEADLDQEVVS
jgi:hypothetical protein